MADIVSTDDVLAGAPRISGTRIGVHHISERVIDGDEDPAAVASDYDLSLADVHRALTYYYDNPDEMRQVRERRNELADGMREVTPEEVGLLRPRRGRESEESA